MADLFDELFTFEMANNHQGSVAHGLKIIEAMARIARTHQVKVAVKLQFRDLDSFIHPDFQDRDDLPHIPRFLGTRLTTSEFRELGSAIRAEGCTFGFRPDAQPPVLSARDVLRKTEDGRLCDRLFWKMASCRTAATQ